MKAKASAVNHLRAGTITAAEKRQLLGSRVKWFNRIRAATVSG